ncbi:hypothetical protein A1F96_00712 [Pyrenophora tritici-repentis]|nr:hypothetical protein A1F96_00712 [Pyrenophora tritici-repentis]
MLVSRAIDPRMIPLMYDTSFYMILYLTLGTTILPLAANMIQPPMRHSPPIGVTGPKDLNFFGSNTSRYILPENMVIPAVKRPIASLFCGATTEVKVRTAEWMSY